MRMAIGALAGAACLGLAGAPAMAGSHSWDVGEIFSNADGTIQFIELKNGPLAGEIFLAGLTLTSTTNTFTFPSNLVGPTTNKDLLLATAGFAALPGAPPPDHIIVDNFFSTSGDTLTYHVYDTISFTPGQLPTNGCHSLNRYLGSLVSGTNSPRNYAGATGTVFVNPANINGDGAVNVLDLIDLLLCFGQPAIPGCESEDVNGDGTVNVLDLIDVLLEFGTACP